MQKQLLEQATNLGVGFEGADLAVIVMRVLVVDDEALIVLLTASWLEDLGCEVETALNGSEALIKLEGDQDIEMLITDVNMPGISGHLVADRAKEIRPDLKVVLLSGAEKDPHGWPLLRKPFQKSDLTRMMADVGGVC